MTWEVEYTNEFGKFWDNLTTNEQESVDAVVRLLEAEGPRLGFPYSSKITSAKVSHLRELRIQHTGKPYRILYAFDPRRIAILLIGGSKTGDKRWYEKFVPQAERLYAEHLVELRKERLDDG